jgi:hypothetical protein
MHFWVWQCSSGPLHIQHNVFETESTEAAQCRARGRHSSEDRAKEGIMKATVMEFGIISIMSRGKVSLKREKTKMK